VLKQSYGLLYVDCLFLRVYLFTGIFGMAIYGYCRVSTDRQADEGESLGAQQRTVEGYAMMHGMTIDRHFIERGISGSKPLAERPEGVKLLAVLKSGDTVITPKLDRLFRSAVDALNVCDRFKLDGISLHMIDLGGDVTGNGISKLVFTILSAVAEAERDRIRERIRDVKADQRRRHRYLGGILPFGWRLGEDGELVPHSPEQVMIQRMVALRRAGRSLRAIANDLGHDGVRLSHAGIRKIIASAVRDDLGERGIDRHPGLLPEIFP
jgi:DNA invertase Pin-like site-specific DNA recombinase